MVSDFLHWQNVLKVYSCWRIYHYSIFLILSDNVHCILYIIYPVTGCWALGGLCFGDIVNYAAISIYVLVSCGHLFSIHLGIGMK